MTPTRHNAIEILTRVGASASRSRGVCNHDVTVIVTAIVDAIADQSTVPIPGITAKFISEDEGRLIEIQEEAEKLDRLNFHPRNQTMGKIP